MDCTLHRYLLDAYLDGELGVDRTLEVEAHLASCQACSSEVQNWKDIRMKMQSPELYHRAPAQLETKLRELLPQTRTERAPWFQRLIWVGGGAAFATAVLLLSFTFMRPAGPSPAQAFVASHIRSMMADHLMDVISTDQHTEGILSRAIQRPLGEHQGAQGPHRLVLEVPDDGVSRTGDRHREVLKGEGASRQVN